jgi:hypothetical protein
MTPTVYNIPPAAMNAKIETGIDAIALSYARTPLQPMATYNTMERASKRPGKRSLMAIPTMAEDHMAISKEFARLLSLS